MKAAIICVGTELLLGDTVNTNASYLGKVLAQLEIHTMRMEVVGDNSGRITEALERASKEHDLILFTGGLGPTVDDITKETVCGALHLDMLPDSDTMIRIYDRIGPKMSVNNFKQAMFPKDAVILKNHHGTAPGMFYDAGNFKVVLLPGPPSELIPMCENELVPVLKNLVNSNLVSKYLHVYGIGESKLEERISDILEQQGKVKIGTYFDGEKVTLRLTSSSPNRRWAYISEVEAKIRKKLAEFIITENWETLEELLVKTLKSANIKLSVAESCTGGMLSERITRVPGSSEVFELGITTYSNYAKVNNLGIDLRTIENFGAVSPNVCRSMAKGAAMISKAELTCAVTGLAGPGGDGSNNKVGTVIIGIYTSESYEHYIYEFKGDRARVRKNATMAALSLLTKKSIEIMHFGIRRKSFVPNT